MSERYLGPLAWLRGWNFRRVEKRRWKRELLKALADDDAAVMEALARLLEQGRVASAAAAEGQAELVRRADAGAADVGGRLEALRQIAADQATRLAEFEKQRQLLETLAEDDAAIMEALSGNLELGRTQVAALERRLEASAADLGERLEALRQDAASQPDRVQGLERRPSGPSAKPGDSFPLIPTSRESLLEPELEVLAQLAPMLAPRVALDVGAHHGRFSRALLDLGFEVHAFEPNPVARAELARRLGQRAGLTIHAVAAGAEDGEADLALVADSSGYFADATQFASLAGLPLPEGLVRTGTVRVPVRRLDALVRERGLASPSVVKVDAEGFDLEVLRGLGDLRPAVLLVEFWDDAMPFSAPGARNRLPDLVAFAREHGSPWHLVVFRRWGDERAAFFAGWTHSPERSWGNVFFFSDRALFERAREHISTMLPEARFVAAPNS